MNKSRKILTAGFLAAVTAMSISLGAAAEEIVVDETDLITEAGESDSVVQPRYVNEYTYMENEKGEKYVYENTKGGSEGDIEIRSGIYIRKFTPGGSINNYYYGASAKVNENDSLKTNITIKVKLFSDSVTDEVEKSDYANELFVDKYSSTSYDYCHAEIWTESETLGSSYNFVNRNF